MSHTRTKPELEPKRAAGYSAMARELVSMFEQVDYHDPAGPAEFTERVQRYVPHRPGFLQLADAFLAKYGAITIRRSKKGKGLVMDDMGQVIAWKRFVMNAQPSMRRTSVDQYGIDGDETQERQAHRDEMVTGEQFTFKWASADVTASVGISVELAYTKKEFLPDGTTKITHGTGRS